MATIIEENRNTLRPAMIVQCGFRETSDDPISLTPDGELAGYSGLANLDRSLLPTIIMDLGGSGFLNSGEAIPMRTESDAYRYGYISEEAAKPDGTFATPFGVIVEAAENWDYVTLEICGQYGDRQVVQVDPVWNAGQALVTVDFWNPGERAYITGVFLGKAWLWDNTNLIGVNLDLHSVNTELGGELEVSSIEIRAYEPTDYTDLIGRIPKGAPIWYSAGYNGDMSELRSFYLSEDATWNNNILTVKGQDATMLLEGVEIPVAVVYDGSGAVNNEIVKRVRKALESINYDEIGAAPYIYLASGSILYKGKAARSIISEYTGIFRDENGLRMTYVDAGIPTFWIGSNGHTWTIYADEISDLDIIVEHNKNELEMVIEEHYPQWNYSIEEVEATSGKTYFIDLDPPATNLYLSPAPAYEYQINSGLYKFTAAADTTYTLEGREFLTELLDANNPYTVSDLSKGETYSFGFDMPIFEDTGGDSLVKLALALLLNRSNILYEFTYRGNPHIQPRDVLNVEIATWETGLKTIDGLYPALDLYPDVDLYPYAAYKKVRKMVKTWVTMTVDTVTLEHSEGGGLSSKIRARKGAV